jgi:DDE family transposase
VSNPVLSRVGGTFLVSELSGWSRALTVTGDGKSVVAHAGACGLRLVADRTGLTAGLSAALVRDGFRPGHDRGRVAVDTAVMMADGGAAIRGIDVLRHRLRPFGPVASASTVCRALQEIDDGVLARVDAARARVRQRVWQLVAARHGGIPAARVPGGDLGEQIVLRIDAHWIEAHSRKEGAAKQRGGFGHFPMAVFCDNTRECLADLLRTGAAGANNADDHIRLLGRAIAQIPEAYRRNVLITADGAGATHKLLDWICGLNREPAGDDPGVRVEFSVGWAIDKYVGPVIAGLPAEAWQPMLTADGTPGIPARLDAESGPHSVGEVAEITHLLPVLRHWPPGTRVIARRVKPLRDTTPAVLPGTGQLALDIQLAAAGWRYEAFATNTAGHTPAWLDARHRPHARVEDRIRVGKHIGAARLPSQTLASNTAWYRLQAIACDLIAWLQLLACHGPLAHAEPRTLQHTVLHAPATLTRHSRRRWLNFPPDWPWTTHIVAIFQRLLALPIHA